MNRRLENFLYWFQCKNARKTDYMIMIQLPVELKLTIVNVDGSQSEDSVIIDDQIFLNTVKQPNNSNQE